MKSQFFIIWFTGLLFYQPGVAQQVSDRTGWDWKMNAVSIFSGYHMDHHHTMSLAKVKSYANEPVEPDRDLSGYWENRYPKVGGVIIGASVCFHKREDNKLFTEIRTGLQLHFGRYAGVLYHQEYGDPIYRNSISYDYIDNELSLAVEYLKGYKLFPRWSLLTGFGINPGITVASEFAVMEHGYYPYGNTYNSGSQGNWSWNIDYYGAKSATYYRAFIPLEARYLFLGDMLEVIGGGRYGVGLQKVIDGNLHLIDKSMMFFLGIQYRLT